MKLIRPQKVAGYAELFVKLHVLTKEQKDDIIQSIKTAKANFDQRTLAVLAEENSASISSSNLSVMIPFSVMIPEIR